MKIVVLDGHAVNPGDLNWGFLDEFGDVTVYERTPEELVAERIGDAEIILINKINITGELLDQCPNLKLICVQATGYNVVDCQAAKERGIPVCNVPAYGTDAVAQFTFALLLELCHQVGHHDRWVHGGGWAENPDFCYWETPQMELAGKTMGIIGFGRIGKAVARIGKAFGMHILAYSRSQNPEGAAIGEYTDLNTLLSRSDIVSLHCPLTKENGGLMGKENLAKMKKGAILLNTARGGLVQEQAVADALVAGHLRGYAADVVSAEPIQKDNPLLSSPNCLLTPHMAWAPVESRQRIQECTKRSIQGYLDGKPVNVVNP